MLLCFVFLVISPTKKPKGFHIYGGLAFVDFGVDFFLGGGGEGKKGGDILESLLVCFLGFKVQHY